MRAQRKEGLQWKEGLAFDSVRGYAFQKKIAKDFEAKIFIGAKNVSLVHKLMFRQLNQYADITFVRHRFYRE